MSKIHAIFSQLYHDKSHKSYRYIYTLDSYSEKLESLDLYKIHLTPLSNFDNNKKCVYALYNKKKNKYFEKGEEVEMYNYLISKDFNVETLNKLNITDDYNTKLLCYIS